jgi:mRNA interferase RelE/StbE
VSYTVLICPRAQRQLRSLPARDQERLKGHVLALGRDPRPPGAVAMKEVHRGFRIRTGDLRIVYTIHEGTVTILVLQVAHRREAYRGSDISAMDRDAREWLADQDQKKPDVGDEQN